MEAKYFYDILSRRAVIFVSATDLRMLTEVFKSSVRSFVITIAGFFAVNAFIRERYDEEIFTPCNLCFFSVLSTRIVSRWHVNRRTKTRNDIIPSQRSLRTRAERWIT